MRSHPLGGGRICPSCLLLLYEFIIIMLTYDLTARGRKTMYEYLYEAMKADILSGRLTAGEKLPSKRAFAEHLQVSVKTVENTYEQLLLEAISGRRKREGILSTVWK